MQQDNNNDDYFDLFVKMRTGVNYDENSKSSTKSVFWAGSGALYEAYSDRVLAKFEGFDVGQGIVQEMAENGRPRVVRQLSRKIFWFRHPETNQIMDTYHGRPVSPIMYEYQAFDYVRPTSSSSPVQQHPSVCNSEVVAALPKGVSGPRNILVSPITCRTVIHDKNTVLFQAPVFCDLDISVPNSKSNDSSRYQAWEFYDYNVDISGLRPPTATWCRQGANPPFVTENRGVLRFVGSRVDQFDQLPESIQEFIASNEPVYGLFRNAPESMEEIKQLEEKALKQRQQQ